MLGCVTIGLLSLERRAVSKYLVQHQAEQSESYSSNYTEEAEIDEEALLKAEKYAYHAGNGVLLALAAALLAMNMLAVPRQGTIASDRSDWFWFWIMPMPSEPQRMYHKLLNQYAPLK